MYDYPIASFEGNLGHKLQTTNPYPTTQFPHPISPDTSIHQETSYT